MNILPLFFTALVGILTYFWWSRNWVKLGNMLETVWVGLMLTHLTSVVSLAIFTLGAIWSPTHWAFVFAGAAGLSISMFVKVTAVKALPNLWHFTERNRRLVAEGRIARFHLENDLAALLPLLFLIWLTHHFK